MTRQTTGFVDLVGTIRARTPEETLAWIRPHFKAMGITRIARVTGLDCIGIPVSTCIRPASRNLSVSQGKGVTQVLADVSAAMEAIELYHAEHVRPASLRGTYRELSRQHELVPPSCFVPGCFPLGEGWDADLEWIRAEELPTGRQVYLPRKLADLDQTQPNPESMRFFISSNGLASGNTLEEATCHALYELIERDARAQWIKQSDDDQGRTEVRTRTISGPCAHLITLFEAANVKVRMWDATSRIGIPTFICYIRGILDWRGLATFGGFGTHHSRDIALSRALTEAAQSRLTIIAGNRDDAFPNTYVRQQLQAAEQLPSATDEHAKHFEDCASPGLGGSFSENLSDLIERLRNCGFERILRVDHTRPEFNIPVVRVLVPGLERPPR